MAVGIFYAGGALCVVERKDRAGLGGEEVKRAELRDGQERTEGVKRHRGNLRSLYASHQTLP